jgi:hypothetical protein
VTKVKQVIQTFSAAAMLMGLLLTGQAAGEKATGPLRVHPANPRYFTDGSGKAIYLTGSHTWANFKDIGETDPPPRFDFEAYLGFLQKYNHNFIRLWTWELTTYTYEVDKGTLGHAQPFPWPRSGPGTALDGKPKFDLKTFNQAYFDRLRSRVASAGERGIYVSIMLFEGHGLQASKPPWCWDGHPFKASNNINGINGDPDGDGRGLETHTLAIPAITVLQEAYVRKVIDTVSDLDNVLYEIANESGAAFSREWQYHLIRYIHDYEKTKPKQHPVGMTSYINPKNEDLFNSPAEWVSPGWTVWGRDPYQVNPPAAEGQKVVLVDTDHLWGTGGDHQWVWKTFLRGHNPIYMDTIAAITGNPEGEIPGAEGARKAMGHTRTMADRMNLADMVPRNDLASTQYCLANPGKEYLVYLPDGGEVTVDLSAASGTLAVEWMHPVEGTITPGGTTTGGAKRVLKPPSGGDAVLHVWRKP